MSGYHHPIEHERSPSGEHHSPGQSDNIIFGLTRRNFVKLIVGVSIAVVVLITILLAVFIQLKPTGPGLIYEPNLQEGGIYIPVDQELKRQKLREIYERFEHILDEYDIGRTREARLWECSPDHYPNATDDAFCLFEIDSFEETCNEWEKFGYSRDSPCIFLFFNKIEDWVPDVYTSLEELPEHMPEGLRSHIQEKTEENQGKVPEMLWVHCEGETALDEEQLGLVSYSPRRGFPAYYFPYRKDAAYMPPVVSIKLHSLHHYHEVYMECRIWAKNVIHSVEDGLGMVTVKIMNGIAI